MKRPSQTYRGARRNAYRNIGKLSKWRDHEGVVRNVPKSGTRITRLPLPADKPDPLPLLDAAE